MNARRRRFAKARRRFNRRVEQWCDRWREAGRRLDAEKQHAIAEARAGLGLRFKENWPLALLHRWNRETHALRAAVVDRRAARLLGFTR